MINVVSPVALAKGILSTLPGLEHLGSTRKTGGTDSARYCYAVWLRHLTKLAHHEVTVGDLLDVAEFGPGDSLGCGLAALMTGAQHYHAIDLVPYANQSQHLPLLEQIAELLTAQSAIPDDQELPGVHPRLANYAYPENILLDTTQEMVEERKTSAAEALAGNAFVNADSAIISYRAPWMDSQVIGPGSLDLVWSQAAMEHVDALHHAYERMFAWLKLGGYTSHQIDLGSHAITSQWNGHWTVPEPLWRVVRGKRPYLINRAPYSVHRQLMEDVGFEILEEQRVETPSEIGREDLAEPFSSLTDRDLVTSSAYFLARKPAT